MSTYIIRENRNIVLRDYLNLKKEILHKYGLIISVHDRKLQIIDDTGIEHDDVLVFDHRDIAYSFFEKIHEHLISGHLLFQNNNEQLQDNYRIDITKKKVDYLYQYEEMSIKTY